MMTPPSQLQNAGTIGLADASGPETIIISPAGPSVPTPDSAVSPQDIPSNPLTPQGIGLTPEAPGMPPPILNPSNPWPKRFLLFFIILCLLVAGYFGYTYVQKYLEKSKQVTLNYWGLWENDTVMRSVITEFESTHPNITIQYNKQLPKQYRERIQSAIDRDEGPDIFRFHNTWVPMMYKYLAAVPSTVMTPAEFSSVFYPVCTTDLVAKDTIYGIPLMIDGLGLYYNEDLFAAAGITKPPATWEELLSIIPKIAKPAGTSFSVSAIALGTTANIEHFSDILANMFMQNGAALTNPKGKEAEETLNFYRRFSTPNDPVYTWNETMDNSIYAFSISKVAMILAPSWRAFELKQMNPGLRFKIAPIPQLPENTITWASYWVEGVSSKSKYKEQAWEFLKFLSSKETMMKLYAAEANTRLFGEPYSRVDLGTTVATDPYVGAYVTQAKDAKSFPLASRTHDEGLNDKMIKYLVDTVNALAGGSSPAQELERLSLGFQQVLSQYGLISASVPAAN